MCTMLNACAGADKPDAEHLQLIENPFPMSRCRAESAMALRKVFWQNRPMCPRRHLDHRSKPREAGLKSAIIGFMHSTVALLKDNISGNVEFANHYSIVTGSSRKSPMMRTTFSTSVDGRWLTADAAENHCGCNLESPGRSLLSAQCGNTSGQGSCAALRFRTLHEQTFGSAAA